MKRRNVAIWAFAVMALCVLCSSGSVFAKSQSTKEVNYYRSILVNKTYKQHARIYDQAKFCFFDVNKDGRKEMFVSGPLGLRSKMFTVVYSYNGKNFSYTALDGTLVKVSSRGFHCEDEDYTFENNGSIYTDHNTCYTLSKNGVVKARFREKKERLYNAQYSNKLLSSSYENASGKSISKKAYKKGLKKMD